MLWVYRLYFDTSLETKQRYDRNLIKLIHNRVTRASWLAFSNAYYRPFSERQPLQPAKGALRALPAFLRKPPRALFAHFPDSGVSIGKVLLP
jgi:hypothetical protein